MTSGVSLFHAKHPMVALMLLVLVESGILAKGSSGQESPCNQVSPSNATFLRQTRLEKGNFALLASTCSVAENLAEWVENELRILAEKISMPIQAKGLIVAIESANDPWDEVANYDPRHADSTEALRNRPHSPWRDRNYACSTLGAYFRQNFSLSHEHIEKLSIPNDTSTFVVFLTTDDYYRRVSEELWILADKSRGQFYDEWGILKTIEYISKIQHRNIDLRLMRLQRREALWLAVLDCLQVDATLKQELKQKVVMQIDADWKAIYATKLSD